MRVPAAGVTLVSEMPPRAMRMAWMHKCGMKKSPARPVTERSRLRAAAGVVGRLFLFGAGSAFAAPLAGTVVHSRTGTAITTGSASRSERTISSGNEGKGTDPIGDRVGT